LELGASLVIGAVIADSFLSPSVSIRVNPWSISFLAPLRLGVFALKPAHARE
jgi:hypothetical protein